mgnify:CR=1 FL=1
MSALMLYLYSKEEKEGGKVMKENVDEILEFIDKNRHKCIFGWDNGYERDSLLNDIDVYELQLTIEEMKKWIS